MFYKQILRTCPVKFGRERQKHEYYETYWFLFSSVLATLKTRCLVTASRKRQNWFKMVAFEGRSDGFEHFHVASAAELAQTHLQIVHGPA